MRINTTLLLLLIAVTVLAFIHITALEFYLYWRYLWLDLPVHVLGGAIVVLFTLSLYEVNAPIPEYMTTLGGAVGTVLIIGLLWESFEIWAGIPIEDNYLLDTTLDVIMDVIGGYIGYIVGLHTRRI